jgi:Domain of unknown function (DUF4274)
MAGGEDGTWLQRLLAHVPPPGQGPEPEWLRLVRDMYQRNYPRIDFRGMGFAEMKAAISAFHSEAPEPPGDEEQIAWLASAGPDDWHRSALTWNWDDGLVPMRWVIAQPGCDAGTAVHLFAMGEPRYWSRYETVAAIEEDAPWGMEHVRFLTEICERWAAGQYRQYRFRPLDLPFVEPGELPWPVPESLGRAEMKGEALDVEGWHGGWPPHLVWEG